MLHFTDNAASYTCFDNLIKESPLKKELKRRGISKYGKSDTAVFKVIEDFIGNARSRAKLMNAETLRSAVAGVKEPHRLNPYTDMHLLLDAIDAFK